MLPLLICAISIANLSIIEGLPFRDYFSCQDHIDNSSNDLRFQRSSKNSSFIFIYMKIPGYDYLSFDESVKICKLCHDADLILPNDLPELSDGALPAWVGVTAYATLNNNQATNVTWTQNIAENCVWPNGIRINGTFAMLAQRWTMPNNPLLAIPLNTSYYSYYGAYPCGANLQVKSLICKTVAKNDTHRWFFQDKTCTYHPKFGCHTYGNHMQRSEDTSGTTVTSLVRIAKLCSVANCTCPVSQWNQWSSCNEFICTDTPRNRTRSRKVVGLCRRNYLHKKLDESEQCPLPSGCDYLQMLQQSNDSSWFE